MKNARKNPMAKQGWAHWAVVATLAGVAGLGAGCNRSGSASPQAVSQTQTQAPGNDSQVQTQVQSRIQGDAALAGVPIQTQVTNGVVTLSGTAPDEAARELAANDAAQVNGVRTVVNNLVVQSSQAAAAPPAAAAAAEQQASADRQKSEEEARLRRERLQKERARKQREQQEQAAQQAQSAPPPPPPAETLQPSVQQQAAPAPAPVPPPVQPVTQTVTIPAGTDLAMRITEDLETGKTQPDSTFHGVLADSLVINGVVAIRRGADVTGRVIDAKDATHFKGQSELSLELLKIKTPDKTLAISTSPLVKEGTARGKNTAEKSGGGALLGTLLGALAGGGRGALIGAVAGAGAGAGANAITRGQQVKIPSESILHFTLNQPVVVTVTTMPGSGPVTSYSSGGNPELQQPPNE